VDKLRGGPASSCGLRRLIWWRSGSGCGRCWR